MTSFLRILIVCCFPFTCFAQLCTGSLGDPVVNITFGTGSNPGPALNSTLTNYTYISTGCPNDGSYTIVNSSTACFNGGWHAIAQDHTAGDNNGYYMLVNSSYAPGDFYVTTVNGLCGGTTYEFAAWIMNVLRPQASGIKPNVTFSIETPGGAVLNSFSTGDIPESGVPVWTQYGFFFQTPQTVSSVVIRMRNNAPGGNGNDLALDDITFRPCGAKVDVSVANYGTQKNIVVCATGNTQNFTLQSSLSAGLITPAYQWQRSTDGVSFTDIGNATSNTLPVNIQLPGNYYYRVSIAEANNISQTACRTSSEVIYIKIASAPSINLADTLNACVGDTVLLTVTGAATQMWTGPNNFSSSQPGIQFDNIQTGQIGKYYLSASSPESCAAVDSVFINVHFLPVVVAMNDTVACSGKSIQLYGQTNSGSLSWVLNGVIIGSGGIASVTVNQNSTYILQAKDNYGCTGVDAVNILSIRSPSANAGGDKEIMQGDSVLLNGSVAGDSVSYAWSPLLFMQNSSTLTPTVAPQQDTYYFLSATSALGCGTAADQVFVKVYKKILAPNIFTPNGDGINDTWIIDGIQTYPESTVQVFNRYGVKVFESMRGYASPWTGVSLNAKPLSAGIYFYVIDTKKTTGKLTGWVMILK